MDVFFNTTSFHEEAAGRIRRELFGGSFIPFLACRDLAVFKAFFNRPQDWVDLQKLATSGSFVTEVVADTLALYVGVDDHRVIRLRSLRITKTDSAGVDSRSRHGEGVGSPRATNSERMKTIIDRDMYGNGTADKK